MIIMPISAKSYADARAVEQAIKAAAINEHQRNPSRHVNDLIRQTHYDRFLCRVFSGDVSNEWVLKGGSAMLARIPSTRRTLDVDLVRSGFDKEQSLEELKHLAAIDLHDHFRFIFRCAITIGQGDNQPYVNGYRVSFRTLLGVKEYEPIHVDMTTPPCLAQEGEIREPANRLHIDRLQTVPYRLYPVESQCADKICAIMEIVGNQPSTRVKDLVDLVILVQTQPIDMHSLREGLRRECALRKIPFPFTFAIPKQWAQTSYRRLAAGTAAEPMTFAQAEARIHRLVTACCRDNEIPIRSSGVNYSAPFDHIARFGLHGVRE